MALQEKNTHYSIEQIQLRHWLAQAQRVGLGAAVARQLIAAVIENTDAVIEQVARAIPPDFPMDLVTSIFSGMKRQVDKLAAQRHSGQ